MKIDAHYGTLDTEQDSSKFRERQDQFEDDDSDEELETTPSGIIAMLGFDPKEFSDEGTKKKTITAGGPGSGWTTERGHVKHKLKAPVITTRVERALKSYQIMNAPLQMRAEANEHAVAAAVGGKSYNDTEPMDVVIRNSNRLIGLEIKTLLIQKNDKLTMTHGAKPRKMRWQRKTGAEMYTVAIDNREGRSDYYVRRGVGSFILGSMKKVGTDPASVAKYLKVNPKKAEDLPKKFPMTKGVFKVGRSHEWSAPPKGL